MEPGNTNHHMDVEQHRLIYFSEDEKGACNAVEVPIGNTSAGREPRATVAQEGSINTVPREDWGCQRFSGPLVPCSTAQRSILEALGTIDELMERFEIHDLDQSSWVSVGAQRIGNNDVQLSDRWGDLGDRDLKLALPRRSIGSDEDRLLHALNKAPSMTNTIAMDQRTKNTETIPPLGRCLMKERDPKFPRKKHRKRSESFSNQKLTLKKRSSIPFANDSVMRYHLRRTRSLPMIETVIPEEPEGYEDDSTKTPSPSILDSYSIL
jgi:hypothetical protein